MIAVDWGTSSFRAFRLDARGRVVDARRSGQGVLASAGRFDAVLREQLAGWDDALVVMSGMIGSRQGWQEVPYVACPAALPDIAAGMERLASDAHADRAIWLVPGLGVVDEDGIHDVMRGEETQICGLLDGMASGVHALCLPGTHSKLVEVADGRIRSFRTAMTGELYALLGEHSLLGRLMAGDAFDETAFTRGVRDAERSGDLLHHLFAVRTHGLFGTIATTGLRAYLSGLLIGHELAMLAADRGVVSLVAPPSLQTPYRIALALRGHAVVEHPEDVAAHGGFALARARGLLGPTAIAGSSACD